MTIRAKGMPRCYVVMRNCVKIAKHFKMFYLKWNLPYSETEYPSFEMKLTFSEKKFKVELKLNLPLLEMENQCL